MQLLPHSDSLCTRNVFGHRFIRKNPLKLGTADKSESDDTTLKSDLDSTLEQRPFRDVDDATLTTQRRNDICFKLSTSPRSSNLNSTLNQRRVSAGYLMRERLCLKSI